MEELFALAETLGFTCAVPLDPEMLIPRQEVRDMCADGKCGAYGRRWSCPPGCGTIRQSALRIQSCSSGILVQTTESLTDEFDFEGMAEAQRRHTARFDTLVRFARSRWRSCLPLSAGACTRCRVCTYPHRPCRFPGQMLSSMEACGLWVSEICEKAGAQYNHGPATITYTSCILI